MRTLCCDVGTSSVRVAIFEFLNDYKLHSEPLVVCTRPINIYNRKPNFYEQKTKEIWSAFCNASAECLEQLKTKCSEELPIKSIGFTATCSFVIVEDEYQNDGYDVIMWIDHRAKLEAKLINQSKNSVLNQFGGICSPEFSLSKLIWLHNNEKNRFNSAKAFMELPDWLCYRCSQWFNYPEEFPRSLCSVVCKWGFDANMNKWNEDLFSYFDMDFESIKKKLGTRFIKPGLPIGHLSVNIASEIGIVLNDPLLVNSIQISAPLIDAHAGALSMLIFSKQIVSSINNKMENIYENILCLICGTSTCHMILNKKSILTHGIWGPYSGVIIPNYFLREGGQSATGKLLEYVINFKEKTNNFHLTIDNLNKELKNKGQFHQTSLIINPTFHGNRSPIADARLKGAIYGLTLSEYSLLDIYVAAIESIAYESKFILETLERNSQEIEQIIVTGGLAKNEFYMQTHADVLGRTLSTYNFGKADHMLSGAAIIAFTACHTKIDSTNEELIAILNKIDTNSQTDQFHVFKPKKNHLEYHQKKYRCYKKLLDCCIEIENILSSEFDTKE